MGEPIIVEAERSGFVESVHLVDVAVVDRAGALVASAGDPGTLCAFRSSAKPLQARVALEAGWKPPSDRSLAVACASHNGERPHLAAARATLAAAGVKEDALRCPADVPAYPDASLGVTQRARVYHNCSGKHASMLAVSALNGWPLASYRDRAHPLQGRNIERMRALLGDTSILVDGCGVPTFTAPLHVLARAFATIDDGGPEQEAMRAHPFLVAGSERLDTDLMTVQPRVLIKAGAEGLACFTGGGYSIATKSRDGFASRSRGPAVMLVLRELGLIDDAQREKLAVHEEPPVLGGGEPVGACRARGSLSRV
ncbi:MAG: asparaginase [Actinomycetota bacterium]